MDKCILQTAVAGDNDLFGSFLLTKSGAAGVVFYRAENTGCRCHTGEKHMSCNNTVTGARPGRFDLPAQRPRLFVGLPARAKKQQRDKTKG
jgi:hypothetical protein